MCNGLWLGPLAVTQHASFFTEGGVLLVLKKKALCPNWMMKLHP